LTVELLTRDWRGENVSIAQIERELARLRVEFAGEGAGPQQRTSVMTHVAWVPSEWLDAAERTLAGLAERHPSRTVLLVPRPEEEDGVDVDLSMRCFPVAGQSVCGEVIELHLRGNRSLAPASLVLPLVISDLPVFLRWRGEPDFAGAQWRQLVDVADRVIVDSSEWNNLAYHELAVSFGESAISDIAWARTTPWRIELARCWPAIAEQEIRIHGPRAEAVLLQGWLNARLERAIRPVEPAGELGVRLGGEELRPPKIAPLTPSDLLSAELDSFARDPVYEEAALAAGVS
jgi:glucose-6-phosphate dehydrogenase assembly protein OpcA